MRSSHFIPDLIYAEMSKFLFRVKPKKVWTQDIPNTEYGDKSIFANYECAEQYK